MSLVKRAMRMAELKADIYQAKSYIATLQKEYDAIRNQDLPDAMESEDMPKFSVKSLGLTCSLYPEVYTSILDPAGGYVWLQENGYGDIIKPYVQPSTFRALVREQLKDGIEFPEDFFRVEPFMQARLRKS